MKSFALDPRFALKVAKKRAARADKRVAVIFGAGWCPDSGALDSALDHELVRPLVEPAFEVVKVNVGNRDKNLDLADELGLDPRRGIPALAILEADGALVASLSDGELANARGMTPLEIATLFHRLAKAAAPAPSETGDS
jgi:thioredoxin 1